MVVVGERELFVVTLGGEGFSTEEAEKRRHMELLLMDAGVDDGGWSGG